MSLPVCKFYNLNQTCRFGKHCKFAHISQRPPPPLHSSNENDKDGIVSTSDPLADKSPEVFSPDSDTIQHEAVSKSPSQPNRSRLNPKFDQSAELENEVVVSENTGTSQDQSSRSRDPTAKDKNVRLCHYFKYGNCHFGRNCRFSHDVPRYAGGKNRGGQNVPPRFRKAESETKSDAGLNVQDEDGGVKTTQDENLHPSTEQGSLTSQKGPNYKQERVCPFFKSGYCRRGDRCRFRHPRNLLEQAPKEEPESASQKAEEKRGMGMSNQRMRQSNTRPIRQIPQFAGQKQMFTYAELEEVGSAKLRDSEISVIKKRFPQDKITVIEDGDNKFSARIIFVPTDPDWPFDVKEFELVLTVTQDYPKKMLIVEVPVDQELPETVRRYVEVSIKEWLDHKTQQLEKSGKVELVFRPFLRWLDKNIEEITTGALKQLKKDLVARAAGLEFIPAQRLQEQFQARKDSGGDEQGENSENGSQEEDDEDEDDTSEEDSEEESSEEDIDGNPNHNQSLDLDPDKKGTEIALRNLQLREKASALMFEKIKIILQCGRCKSHSELNLPQGRVMSVRCGKCNHNQFVNYRPALIHQFSSIVGYLDVDGCQPFDLILQDSWAVVTCMGCSKQTRIDGLVTGQMIDGWCKACNGKFKLATEAVKFTHLVPSGVDTSNQVQEVAPTRTKKPPKDPAIKEGQPLPEFGTCKHYKHSYRWLRFPCCGKAYPCDVCHDKKEDHEMVRANRMICGHCCKEQNFSASRPCNTCGQHLTKIHSAHWEGGSGCRDKIVMSKADQQKYKNMNKTVSNHKKKVQGGQSKKKNIKLRHA